MKPYPQGKFIASRQQGFGLNLYRNLEHKKIGGVCAGLADHFEIDRNIMRVMTVAAFLFTGPLAFWSYIAAWIVLYPKTQASHEPDVEYDEDERRYRKKKLFRYKEHASDRLQSASKRLDEAAARVEAMERYVTSRRYELNKKFADL